MDTLDWVVITTYLVGMVVLSAFLGRGQQSHDDYYVGGRNLPWWAVGISTMATQTSAISFISIPAFVALKEGGGLKWLQYELSVPLAMIFVMVFLIPFFRKLELISVYEYLERRFSGSVRLMLSGVFLISRALATGVGVYASGIVLEVCLGIPLWSTIILIGGVTIVYDTIGGMTAVVYSDVIQMVVLVGGLLVCIGFAIADVGGVGEVIASLPQDRWRAFDPSSGLWDGQSTPFWGFLIGGFFLYVSYYGVDQSQAQRELSAPTLKDTKRSLVFNGLARFPLTILYLALGISVGAFYRSNPEFAATISADNLDALIPSFIVHTLPSGVRALLFAALLAAAMSSLDSALNSLSAATLQDFVERNRKLEPERLLKLGRIITVSWGCVITGFAFVVGRISPTVIEGINKIGSVFYAPLLAAFLAGVASRRANTAGVIAGVVVGVATNLMLWAFAESLNWMWWNVFGLVTAVAATQIVSRFGEPPSEEVVREYTLSGAGMLEKEREWIGTYAVLVGYFVLIVICVLSAHAWV